MRTENPTVTSPDLLNLIWTRAGSPVRPARLTDTADVLDVLTQAAMQIRRELDIYIRRSIRLAAACHETPRCAGPDCTREIAESDVGRTRIYCSDACRKQASRSRKRVRSQAAESPAIRGAVG